VKKTLSLVVALGAAALFSSVTLAGAECAYHKTQAAVTPPSSSSPTQDVTTVSNNDPKQVQTAQAEPSVKPADVKNDVKK